MKCPKCESTQLVHNGFSSPVACNLGRKRQRLLCKNCQHRFSSHRYCMNYRLRKNDLALNSKIFQLFIRGLSERQIAKFFEVSHNCVAGRLERLARRALAFHLDKTQSQRIYETIAYDGMENFAGSQYDPNNINHALGSESLFIYDFNFAGLNRKGRTSPRQKKVNALIEAEQGRYNPRSIRIASRDIFKRLQSKTQRLELLSDEHFHYKKALKDIEGEARKPSLAKLPIIEGQSSTSSSILHKTVSSKACRNFQNILFSVNHMDLLLRERLACFSKETISFSKKAGRMCQKYALFMVYKNYMVPQFSKKQVRRPGAHLQSPAEELGICQRLLKFGDVFARLSLAKDIKAWSEDWMSFWHGEIPTKFQRSKEFVKA